MGTDGSYQNPTRCVLQLTGNSGSAFLQIDVGRSSWPLDKPFVTLLPTATLMSPTDSRLGKNCRAVRMFKEGDFLEEAASEKWDRLRITCSQPFNKQEQFGLSFIRIRSPLESENPVRTPAAGVHQVSVPNSMVKTTREDGETAAWSHLEEKLMEKLQQAVSPSSARSERMSRTARMVLSAAKSRKRSHPITAPLSPPIPCHSGESESPVSSGSCPETSVTRHSPVQKEAVNPSGRRRLNMAGSRGRAPSRQLERQPAHRRERDSPHVTENSPETARDCSSCPICAGYFPTDYLPTHASTCGEDAVPHSITLSSEDDSCYEVQLGPVLPDAPVSWVQCPLCEFRFQGSEIEQHASSCGE
ncbi:protein XNDC1N isoform X2 [Pseudophryne corroboree]|uniref:protein XNDC1N isoform X2 n=1 Tax=Pseudophryne corroboree TaxID=495146 RepID=UPI003082025D